MYIHAHIHMYVYIYIYIPAQHEAPNIDLEVQKLLNIANNSKF